MGNLARKLRGDRKYFDIGKVMPRCRRRAARG